MLQCAAVCCSVLQRVAVYVLKMRIIGHRVMQCVAVCCSVLQCVAVCCSVIQCVVLQCVAHGCCSTLQGNLRLFVLAQCVVVSGSVL